MAAPKLIPNISPNTGESPGTSAITPGTGLVLMVDDEEGVLNFSKIALERGGFRVAAARSGREALDIFEVRAHEIEVVILDLNMPGMDGEAVLIEMKRVDPAVRVILSTGYGEADAMERFQGYGLAGYLSKPYTSRVLAEKIHAVLNADQAQAAPPGN